MKMDSARLPLAILAAATFLSLSGAASAAPVIIQDSIASGLVNTGAGAGNPTPATWYQPHDVSGGGGYSQTMDNSNPNTPSWAVGKTATFGDIVGGNEFDIKTLKINRTATSISFTIETAYQNNDGSGAKYADIFIDTTSPTAANTWNYGIALGSAYTRDGMAAGLYQLSGPAGYLTSDQVWANQPGYGIGGLIQPCQPGAGSCTGAAAGWSGDAIAPATLVNKANNGPGNKIGDVSVSIANATTVLGDGQDTPGYILLTATITNVTDWSIFDRFDVLASSADCANDALWGTVTTTSVPAPGALALLGFGLLGFGGLRRKARTA